MKIDLTWTSDGIFTSFLANSNEGLEAYKEIVRVTGANKVLDVHRESTLRQLKDAGYRVRKSTAKPKPFNKEDADLLAELGV